MYVSAPTSVKAVSGFFQAILKIISAFFVSFIRGIVPLAVTAIVLFANDGYAQSKKSKEKLGLVRVKSEGFARKKQRETSTFTGRDFNKGGAQSIQRKKQRESSTFIGTAIKVNKNSGNRIGNPADAAAYKRIKSPKRGRNPMGEQIARKSQAYKGSSLVKSAYKKRKEARHKSKQISKYRGDLIVKKRPKGAHPSAVYRGGKTKNSYQQKENYRKRMLKRIGRNKNSLQPNYLRKKNRDQKPTYDSRESEIWNKPR